ncbi:MAG: sugar nucleotide-binding protein [Fuerstiella sp.]|nr:sugar nucleotide-binding protein [Fuerstiella sp.]
MLVLLGGSGYVGQALQAGLSRRGLEFSSIARSDVDYTDALSLKQYLQSVRPQYVFNAAGYTGRPNVDACELHRAECLAGNGVLPGTVRTVCEDLKIPWGHVSSGCIFTGTRSDGIGFRESDDPNFTFRQDNCSFYSGCKALGEEVLQGAERCWIWRLRIPFNHVDSPRNYITKMMNYPRLLNATNSLSHLDEFADACIDCTMKECEYGLWNLTNPGSITTRQVIERVQQHGLSHRPFEFFESEEQFLRIAAKTPRSNCVLDSSKAVAAGLPLSPVEEALEKAMKNWIRA